MKTLAAIATRLVSTLTIVAALLALSVLSAVPTAFDEDRSEPGFCSPDCPLQHDAARSVAIAPALAPRGLLVAPAQRAREAPWTPAYPVVAASPDVPRAPPDA